MVALSTAAGYVLALPQGVIGLAASWEQGVRFFLTLCGTLLTSGGSGALNQYAEWTTDQSMSRTRRRPIPAGIVSPRQGLLWGLTLCFLGLALLLMVDFLVLLLATLTVVSYIVFYTPMKRRSPVALYVGAVPGALPAAGGWIAASGVGWGAVLVFLVLYFWQLPHFLALSWLYRKDYAQAGLRVLALVDGDGHRVGWQSVLSSLALVASSVAVGCFVEASLALIGAVVALGMWLLWASLSFLWRPSFASARSLLWSAYVYLLGFVAFAAGVQLWRGL